MPFIHLLTTSEPYFFHHDGRFISQQDFTGMDIRWYVILDHDDGKDAQYIGVVSVGFLDTINRSAGIGFVLLPDFRGTAMAGRCYDLMMDYVFNTLNLHKAWASVVEDNKSVWDVLQRKGWKWQGTMLDAQFIDGKYHNRRYLELINPAEK